MWIASTIGWFSVVHDRERKGGVSVRARAEADIRNLYRRFGKRFKMTRPRRAPLQAPRLQPPTARRSTMNRIISAVLTASALIFGVSRPREGVGRADDARISWELGRSFQSRLSRTARKPIFLVPIRKAKRRARLTATFRSSSPVRIFHSSHPTIARQELQKKTRPSCREALPTSA
jgi:hypothetical protein